VGNTVAPSRLPGFRARFKVVDFTAPGLAKRPVSFATFFSSQWQKAGGEISRGLLGLERAARPVPTSKAFSCHKGEDIGLFRAILLGFSLRLEKLSLLEPNQFNFVLPIRLVFTAGLRKKGLCSNRCDQE